jgi:Ca2+:H+ antiporter
MSRRPGLLERHHVARREAGATALAILLTAIAAVLQATSLTVATFVVSAVALAVLATLVGSGTEQLGARLGPGATGVLQSALGNLPELFIGIFALRASLVSVVQAALIGSILGNSLLVLGLAFALGGLRHGTQRFNPETPRNIATLTLLAASAIVVPTLATRLNTPAAPHAGQLSVACAIVLLVVFVASIPFSLRGGPTKVEAEIEDEGGKGLWPLALTVVVLLGAGVGAAFVSDWFTTALTPATQALHLSERFTGLVIVALAGNAVENVVGVQLMLRNKPDYAISVILNSSLQVALALIPALVLLSLVIGGTQLTLVMPILLLGGMILASLLGALIVYDGESTWLEGVALIGLYVIIAAGFWWG